jgi:NAD-dependent dihydropyrimidine dehydrogenase PreA subunit
MGSSAVEHFKRIAGTRGAPGVSGSLGLSLTYPAPRLGLGLKCARCVGSAAANPGGLMPFVIAEPCIGVKDKSCVEVCPVNCIYEGEDQYYIHPDECIDCQACEAACPVQAIFPDNTVPEKWKSFIDKNKEFFANK